MVTPAQFKNMALAMPEVAEAPHMDKTAFKVSKKIFATLNISENRCCLKFSEIDQSVYCLIDLAMIYPVPNKWGKQGWTLIQLGKIKKELLQDALNSAYCNVASPKLAQELIDKL